MSQTSLNMKYQNPGGTGSGAHTGTRLMPAMESSNRNLSGARARETRPLQLEPSCHENGLNPPEPPDEASAAVATHLSNPTQVGCDRVETQPELSGRRESPWPVVKAGGDFARHPACLDLQDEETVLSLLCEGIRLAANRRGMSERTLRRLFEREGLCLRDCLQGRRRELTVHLLEGHLSVGSVAERLGFSSSQTFARYLRREFGMTATGLRRSMRCADSQATPNHEADA